MGLRYLILGGNSSLGQGVSFALKKSGEVFTVGRKDFSVNDSISIKSMIRHYRPDVVINCIALMPADKCEIEPELSYETNFQFPQTLWESLQNTGVYCFAFSSDFVFDGNSSKPYLENSTPSPLGIYGEHKAMLENYVREQDDEFFRVLRFSSLVTNTNQRKTFLEKVVDSARKGNTLKLVSDLTISVSSASLISNVIINSTKLNLSPVSNVSHSGSLSWDKLAKFALDHMGIQYNYELVESGFFPSVARRPIYSVLEPSKSCEIFNDYSWQDAVIDFLKVYNSYTL